MMWMLLEILRLGKFKMAIAYRIEVSMCGCKATTSFEVSELGYTDDGWRELDKETRKQELENMVKQFRDSVIGFDVKLIEGDM